MDSQEVSRIKQELRDEGYNLYVHSHPAGMFFPEHKHDHVTLHIILSGKMSITMDGEVHFLQSGDRLEIPADTDHSAEVLGESPVVCIDARK